MRPILSMLAVLWGLVPYGATPARAEEPREVSAELAKVLTAGQRALEAGDAGAALRILSSYAGDPDPLQRLLEGYAHHDLEAYDEAERAFEQALELDDTLIEARQGLARTRVVAGRWKEAVQILKTFVDVDNSSAAEIGLYARAAFEQGDLRLATLLTERGLVRFPDDLPLRRLDVALLLQRRAYPAAMEAALAVLVQVPEDPLAWRQLAAAADRVRAAGSGDEVAVGPEATLQAGPLALAALEAAELVDPGDMQVRLRRAAALFERGAVDAAADALAPQRWPSKPASATRLAVRAHLDAGRVEGAIAWADAHPEALSGPTRATVEVERRLGQGAREAAEWAEAEGVVGLLPTELMVRVARGLPEADAQRWFSEAGLRPDGWASVARAESRK